MAIEKAVRYEGISPKAYEHPADRAATSALHSIPLLDRAIKDRAIKDRAIKRLTDLGVKWVGEGDFDRIRSGDYIHRGQEPPLAKEFEPAVAHYRDRFSKLIDRTTGGVQRLGDQISTWLKNKPPGAEAEDGEEDWLP